MKTSVASILLFLPLVVCLAAEKHITFQEVTGHVHSNVTVLAVEKDGVLLKYWDEARYGRVKFTNMTEEVQLLCGYDAKKLQRQREEKTAKEKAAREKQIEAFRKRQATEVERLVLLVRPAPASELPTADATKRRCKDIIAELAAINTATELGVSYNKFTDVLTDSAIKIQKLKESFEGELPSSFKTMVEAAIGAYNRSRDDWRSSIQTDLPSIKAWRDYFLQEKWQEASIHLTLLRDMVDGRSEPNDSIIEKAVKLVRYEQAAADSDLLPATLRSYGSIALLSDDEIAKRIRVGLDQWTVRPAKVVLSPSAK